MTRDERRERALELLGLGWSAAQAAPEVGIHFQTVLVWARAAGMTLRRGRHGGIVPPMEAPAMEPRVRGLGVRLDRHDRCQIEVWLNQGCSQAWIARQLGVHRSTITREVASKSVSGRYVARSAQNATDQRRRRPRITKLEANPRLRGEVVRCLNLRFSPRQVGMALADAFPDEHDMHVSHETIYQAIYVQTRGSLRHELSVDKALRSGRTSRVPRSKLPKRSHRPWLAGHEISTRPPEADDRAVPGHWEGDLVIGARHRSALITLVERRSRYTLIARLPGPHDSQTVVDTLIEMIATLPEHLRGSLTWDQGPEMAHHTRLTLAHDMNVYFCDPHSPWQRGTNENTNGLIRDFYPKGTDFNTVTDAHIAEVQHLLNIRPRQTLDGKTPTQKLLEQIVAVTP